MQPSEKNPKGRQLSVSQGVVERVFLVQQARYFDVIWDCVFKNLNAISSHRIANIILEGIKRYTAIYVGKQSITTRWKKALIRGLLATTTLHFKTSGSVHDYRFKC